MESAETQLDDTPDLKDPVVAACLAWLVPGLGHLYQRRIAKAVLYFVCIFGLFAGGLYLGGGRVVYFSMRSEDRRLPYLCQVCVGIPALPALVQAQRFRSERLRDEVLQREAEGKPRFFDWFMAPPEVTPPEAGDVDDELDRIHFRLHRFFELGNVYTMIAGLLNVLAIYDAWGGPAVIHVETDEEAKEDDDEEERQRRKAS